jgi:hypothetical protein
MSDRSAASIARQDIISTSEWQPFQDPSPLTSEATLSSRALIRLAWTNPGPTSYAVRALPREAVAQLERRLAELLVLPDNWDGQGGRAPSRTTAVGAAAIVVYCMAAGALLPRIDATTTGAIHAEWYAAGNVVELEVASAQEATFYYRFKDGSGWEGDFWHVRGSLERVFARFQ